ncbi:hypothetical protein CVT25_010630 [Psilocybe cyanescens]|uniref:Protein kinase domain-containing protein n=1 Tax=Psilocybe cyanescens TaxID=93625 RepID=A0A409WJZ0_PSICY|nr:hypothetical protein CVT25_010630 [Psilocybe cyanescens]
MENRVARFNFWDSPSTAQWFKGHGYTLYQRVNNSAVLRPTFPSEFDSNNADYPYAYCDSETSRSNEQPLEVYESRGKIAYAQDSLNRHVVIKIVPAGTEEYRILRFLNEQKLETLKDNCVIPVLDLLPVEGFWFVVMPRWGYSINLPYMGYMHEVVTIIHSLLKVGLVVCLFCVTDGFRKQGLAYLHEHNIVHGDIAQRNFLVNHFSCETHQNQKRANLRSNQRLLYAIIDFDFSVMLSPEADRNQLRLPYYESWSTYHPAKDTHAGEFDFNPFIFDVGVMGVLLCVEFQRMSQKLPILAPLLDRMTTWDLERRFTASEALHFFEERLSEITKDQLQLQVDKDTDPQYYDEYDRWTGLSPDFVEKWKAYRTPPLPWHMRFLRRICQVPYISHIVPRTRLFFYRLSLLCRRLLAKIFPSKIASPL